LFLLVLILLLMPTLNFLPVWFALSLLRFRLPSRLDRKSGSAGMPRPNSYAVFCLKKKIGLAPPPYSSLLTPPSGTPIFPDVFVFDKDFENPRTLTATLGYERRITSDLAASITYTHSRTDHLTRFINRNDALFGKPWGTGLPGLPGNTNGINTLTTVESSAKSRYNAVTVGLKRTLDPRVQFQVNYTLSFDKSDDDNERDPFTFRYARADNLAPEYNWSDRDQRHRVNGWLLARLP